jgi:aspartate carbamoyltransferase catalytic subunit
MALPFRHLVNADQLTRDCAAEIFDVADYMQRVCDFKGRVDLLSDKILGFLFFEPSSRTMLSFQSAAQRLQAGVIFAQGKEMSSLKKSESVSDTVRVTSGYCDLLVMRHELEGAAAEAAEVSMVPFVNAGDGSNEHPTQCLIDGYTIRRELGRIDGIHIAIGFDPLQSRAIHSLARFLSKYDDITISFMSPEMLSPKPEFVETLRSRGVTVHVTHDMGHAASADVIYLNRLQEERFANAEDFERLRQKFTLRAATLAGRSPLVLDPLPRIDEIATEVDTLPTAAYFRQAHYGVPVRMALLTLLLGRF